MAPTLAPGDWALVATPSSYSRGDVVVVEHPGRPGFEMVKRIVKHPDLQLVGLYCYSPDKIGRDAGDIVGIGPIGVTANGTIDARKGAPGISACLESQAASRLAMPCAWGMPPRPAACSITRLLSVIAN